MVQPIIKSGDPRVVMNVVTRHAGTVYSTVLRSVLPAAFASLISVAVSVIGEEIRVREDLLVYAVYLYSFERELSSAKYHMFARR